MGSNARLLIYGVIAVAAVSAFGAAGSDAAAATEPATGTAESGLRLNTPNDIRHPSRRGTACP